MANNQLDFVFPDKQGFAELIHSLRNGFSIRQSPAAVYYRTFYDTVDWLLRTAGSALELHEDGQSQKLYWRAHKDAPLRIQLGLKQVPQLAKQLPAGEFRQQLASVISVRELNPRIQIKVKRIPLAVLNKNEKVVVRINLDENWFYPVKTRAGTLLGKRICVKAVKGYDEAFDQVEAFFHEMDLRPSQDNMMKLALAESKSSTIEYSTKLKLLLDPEMPAEEALKAILLRLLEIMEQNTAGAIKGTDIEFMHDYRVSIRKTRSALTLIKRVFPKKTVKKYSKFFSGLGKLTNPVRDMDVFLLKLESYAEKLGKSKQEQLQPLRQYLQDNRDEAQQAYVDTVTSAEYRQVLKDWRDYLENTDPIEPPQKNSRKPVSQLANELIWSTYQVALKEGNAITDETEAEALHELRKTCKKLRYLMEFFQSLYPAKKIRELINALKGLQDNLGDFNDYHVHMDILKGFNEAGTDEAAIKVSTKMISRLDKKQHATRNSFAERFRAFSSQENQNEFRELFVVSHDG